MICSRFGQMVGRHPRRRADLASLRRRAAAILPIAASKSLDRRATIVGRYEQKANEHRRSAMASTAVPVNRSAVSLPLQMLLGLVLGLAIAFLWPSFGAALQPLGTAFIEAIKMVVIPLV